MRLGFVLITYRTQMLIGLLLDAQQRVPTSLFVPRPSSLYRHDVLILHRNHLFHFAVEFVGEFLHLGFAGFGFIFR